VRRKPKNPPQVHQVHFMFAFMSLEYELVDFDMFIKFIKFIRNDSCKVVSCQLLVKDSGESLVVSQ
jgi:hypothetical protein